MEFLNTVRKIKDLFVRPNWAFKRCTYEIARENYIIIRGSKYIGLINQDVSWKTKFGDVRYEFPPAIGICLFGYCMMFIGYAPSDDNDHYWEAALEWSWADDKDNIEDFIASQGFYITYNNDERIAELVVELKFLRPEYKVCYDNVVSRFIRQYPQYKWKCS